MANFRQEILLIRVFLGFTDSSAMPHYACAGCSTQTATSKLCAGCSVVYYCSKECQRIDWTCHIFSCNPRRPINTADYLALAVRKRELPEDTQTLVDWGIARAAKHHTVDDVDALLGMYAELLEWVGIKPLQLHKWRRGGNLVHRIKGVYDSLPDGHRSPSYRWLITHEAILETPLVTKEVLETIFDRMKRRVWLQLGHSPSASSDEITDFIQSLPALRRTCFTFIAVCLEDMYPPITSDLYLNFGFGACRGPKGYNVLGRAYHDLMLMVSFEQFYEAYNSGKLYELFTAKNVAVALDEIELAGLADILAGAPGANKTVWDLQQSLQMQTPRGGLCPNGLASTTATR